MNKGLYNLWFERQYKPFPTDRYIPIIYLPEYLSKILKYKNLDISEIEFLFKWYDQRTILDFKPNLERVIRELTVDELVEIIVMNAIIPKILFGNSFNYTNFDFLLEDLDDDVRNKIMKINFKLYELQSSKKDLELFKMRFKFLNKTEVDNTPMSNPFNIIVTNSSVIIELNENIFSLTKFNNLENKKEFIDSIAEKLISNFTFSALEHSEIYNNFISLNLK